MKDNQKSKAYISLEKKSHECIENNQSLYEYYKHLIVPKTYGTFRIYANSLEKLIALYLESGDLTEDESKDLKSLISEKRKNKERKVDTNVDLMKFLSNLEDYIDDVEISERKRNVILSIFFIPLTNIKTLINLKNKDISFKETKLGIIVSINTGEETINIVARKYTNLFKTVFEEISNNEYVFSFLEKTSDQNRAYHLLNDNLESELEQYDLKKNVESVSPFKIILEVYKKSELKNILFEI